VERAAVEPVGCRGDSTQWTGRIPERCHGQPPLDTELTLRRSCLEQLYIPLLTEREPRAATKSLLQPAPNNSVCVKVTFKLLSLSIKGVIYHIYCTTVNPKMNLVCNQRLLPFYLYEHCFNLSVSSVSMYMCIIIMCMFLVHTLMVLSLSGGEGLCWRRFWEGRLVMRRDVSVATDDLMSANAAHTSHSSACSALTLTHTHTHTHTRTHTHTQEDNLACKAL